jgi:S-disulfanyl-L-cysteine oxidoreductase SoxD
MSSNDDNGLLPAFRNYVSRRKFLTAAAGVGAAASDGSGLPAGSGTVAHGKSVYEANCAACHGPDGQGGIGDRLAGGQGTLASDKPIKTVGSFWPYATTLFDYIHRAMPYQAAGSLSVDDTYAVAAYILNLNGILPADAKIDQETLPRIRMPNRNGFIPEAEFRNITNSR